MQTCRHFFGEAEDKAKGLENYIRSEYGDGAENNRSARIRSIMKTAIKKELTERQRTILRKFYFDKMSAAEIADELNISRATVYKHLRLSKEKLRSSMEYFQA